MPETRFVILCYPRTGSNYLCGLLGSHPEILCHHEVFNAESISYAFEYRDGQLDHLGDVASRDADPFDYLDRLWSEGFGHRAVGIKLLRGQGEVVLPSLVADPEVKKILLERANYLQTYVSWQRAVETGRFAHQGYDDVRIEVDPADFLAWSYEYRAWYRDVRGALAGQDVMELVYEDLVAAGDAPEVVRFLGVDPGAGSLAARNRKQSTGGLREAIANFDELAEALAGTVFRDQLLAAA